MNYSFFPRRRKSTLILFLSFFGDGGKHFLSVKTSMHETEFCFYDLNQEWILGWAFGSVFITLNSINKRLHSCFILPTKQRWELLLKLAVFRGSNNCDRSMPNGLLQSLGASKTTFLPLNPTWTAGMSVRAVVESEDYFHWRQTADGKGMVSLLMGLVISKHHNLHFKICVLAPPSLSVHLWTGTHTHLCVHKSENIHTLGKCNTATLRRSNIPMCFRLWVPYVKLPPKKSSQWLKSAANTRMYLRFSGFVIQQFLKIYSCQRTCFMRSSVKNKMMEDYAISWATPWSQTSSHEGHEALLACGPVFLWPHHSQMGGQGLLICALGSSQGWFFLITAPWPAAATFSTGFFYF